MDVLDENGLSRVWDKAVAKVAASQANPVMTGSVSANRKEGTTVGDYSNTFGYNCTASGDYAFAEGYTTTASGDYSHSAGNNTTASGNFSNAWGDNTLAVGAYSHVEGTQTKAIGDYAHAEGYKGQAVGQGSHAEGADTLAVQQYAHAEGWGSQAVGAASHAEGNATKAYNNNSHSEGFESEAGVTGGNNQAPHAEGYQTKSTGRGSHSEGYKTVASGDQSHAEGSETTASGSGSHAEGVSTTCSGSYSHVEGQGTTAASDYQHIHGKYNILDNNNTYVTIIGNGSSTSSRSNAFTLDWNGNGIFAGKLTVGTAPSNTMDVATKGYTDNIVHQATDLNWFGTFTLSIPSTGIFDDEVDLNNFADFPSITSIDNIMITSLMYEFNDIDAGIDAWLPPSWDATHQEMNLSARFERTGNADYKLKIRFIDPAASGGYAHSVRFKIGICMNKKGH